MTQSSEKQGRPLYDMVVEYTSTLDAVRKRRLADFLEVQDQTIRSWQRGKTVPSGLRALRLHYLFEKMGQVNSDWRLTHQVAVDVGKLLAFKVLTLDAVIAEFKGKINDEKNVILMLCGHAHIKPEFLAIFQRIADDHAGLVEEATNSWSDLMIRDSREQFIAELSTRLVAVLPLCEQMMTDDWSAEERHELRRRCGTDTVFKLYNALGALCGEKARQHTLKTAAASLVINR